MSTATAPTESTQVPTPAPVDVTGDRVPFTRLVGIELRKMVDTRAGMWMLVVMTTIGFLIAGGLVIWGQGGEDHAFSTFLGFIFMPMVMLLPIMGIMSATQEWSQRTGLATFTLVPRRGRVVGAKVAAAVALCLVLLLAGALAASLATLVSGGEFTLTGLSLAGLVLAAVIYTLQGVAFGAALLSTPMAIVASLALPTVWTILTAMIQRMQDVAAWLDLQLVTGPLTEGTMTGENWGQLATATAFWVGLPMAIGTYRILTREVK